MNNHKFDLNNIQPIEGDITDFYPLPIIKTPDFEELMLQISDVMRAANKLRPSITHEEAVLKIYNIVVEVSVYAEYLAFVKTNGTL